MHLGFKGETQVTDQLTSYSQWEYQIQGNSAENKNNSWTHVAFAGLKFQDVGSFNYSHNYSVVYDITSWTNILPEFSGDTYSSDNFMQQHGNSFATYHNTDFFSLVDSLNFAVQYQGKNSNPSGEGFTSGITNNSHDTLRQNSNSISSSITYDYKGFSISGAISSSKHTDAQNTTAYISNSNHAETYTGGLKYNTNNIYQAAQYTQTYNTTHIGSLGWANKAQNFKAVAQYQFNFSLHPSLAYLQSKGKNLGHGYNNKDILKYVDVGATYYFNKNMSTYIDYKINLLDNNQFTHDTGINTDNIIALGLVYQF